MLETLNCLGYQVVTNVVHNSSIHNLPVMCNITKRSILVNLFQITFEFKCSQLYKMDSMINSDFNFSFNVIILTEE